MLRNKTEHSTVPVVVNQFNVGLITNRNPLHPPIVNGNVYQGADVLIDGLNTEVTTDNTLARRPGFPPVCSMAIPSGDPLGFAELRSDSTPQFLDTTTDVFKFDNSSITSIYTKNTTEQSHFQQVANHMYWADGTDARRLVLAIDGLTSAKWGIDPPDTAPTVSQVPITGFASWAANTFFNPSLLLLDSNGNLQKLTTAGTTGGGEPVWSTVVGNTTADNTAVWTCQGTATRATNHAYTVGQYIRVAYSKTVSYQQFNYQTQQYETVSYTVNYDDFFKCSTAGTSSNIATASLTWFPGIGSGVIDGTVVWINAGPKITWATIGAATLVSIATSIVDSNGNLQNVLTAGKSGGTHPTWATTTGSITADSGTTWSNAGPVSAANTGFWKYLYVYKQTTWNFGETWYHISAGSPVSFPIILGAGYNASITGVGSNNSAVTAVDIYRTKQGGSIYYFLGSVTSSSTAPWQFLDTLNDDQLDTELTVSTVPLNLPPPAGATLVSFFQGRVFVSSGSFVYFDGGGDITNGDPHQSFPLANVFEYPSDVTALIPTSQGLIVQLADQSAIIKGGPSTLTFYSQPLLNKTGVLSQNCVQQDQDTVFEITSQAQGIAFSPSDFGEFGQNVTDTLADFPPFSSYMALHRSGVDVGIFLSNNDGKMIRFNPTTGAWSPVAEVVGCGPIASLTGGTGYVLLTTIDGYICGRNLDTFTDGNAAATYAANGVIGSVEVSPMSVPTKALRHVFSRTTSAGSQPTIGILQNSTSGSFSDVPYVCSVPAQLDNTPLQSSSVRQQRFDMQQSQGLALDRFNHFQVKFSWPAEAQRNELIGFTVGDTAQ